MPKLLARLLPALLIAGSLVTLWIFVKMVITGILDKKDRTRLVFAAIIVVASTVILLTVNITGWWPRISKDRKLGFEPSGWEFESLRGHYHLLETGMPIKKQVYNVTIDINGDVKILDKPVEVRRVSELNGMINNYQKQVEVGDTISFTATRAV
jgi:hypothetical protein